MSLFNKVSKTFQWGQHTVTMETGEIARQASGAVLVKIDDTVVLATVVGSKTAKAGQDFFPLTVDYIEKNPKVPAKGIIAVQIHSGGKAKVEFKNITINAL